MKKIVTLAGRKIVRFFWSWGFLKFVLVVATLIVLLYAEEDWRGARAWAATKAKWEARGISFDPNAYIPNPVPDAENLAALPLFDPAPDTKIQDSFTTAAMAQAFHKGVNDGPPFAPSLNNDWQRGKGPDFEELRIAIAAYYGKVFGVPPATGGPLAQWDALYPFVAELDAESKTRVQFRLREDYLSQPAVERTARLLTSQIQVAKVLSVHAVLAMNQGRPEVAVEDIRTMLEISQGVGNEPSLVAGLVSGGICSLTSIVISHGVMAHAWNDAQLAEIQAALGESDMLAVGRHALRGECVVYSLPMIEMLKARKNQPGPWTTGWIDQNLSRTADVLLNGAAMMDPATHRVNVDATNTTRDKMDRLGKSWFGLAPWNMLAVITTGAIGNAQRQFAHIQTRTDEGEIACALERYRLVHGVYPTTLDLIAPSFIGVLPHDVINGEPYRYRLNADGTYLLYSVGWNQSDDGGKIALIKDAGTSIDYTQGDWVWPTPIYPTR